MEISKDDERADLSEKAKEAYTLAEKVAENLSPTHPIRLGLALNFSVYYYEIAQNPQEACDLAKKAFDAAIAKLDSTSEDTYKAGIAKYTQLYIHTKTFVKLEKNIKRKKTGNVSVPVVFPSSP